MNAWPAWSLRFMGAEWTEELLKSAPSPIAREYLATTRAIGGAFRFHEWAASRLPESVRESYGERLALGANHLLAGDIFARTKLHEWAMQRLPNPVPNPSVSGPLDLTCRLCVCEKDKGKQADCLIARFHRTFRDITAESIAEWYFSLDGQAEKDVRAFFRSEAETSKTIRKAFGRILAQEMSPELSQREGVVARDVILRGKAGRQSESLRDAFMYTALLAAHEWTGIKGAYRPEPKDDSPEKPKGDRTDDCAALVARKFDVEATTVRNQWPKFRRAALENIKYQEPLIR